MSFVIAIDGPSGAGKSSTARAVASRLGILFLDTGALYRAIARRVLEAGIAAEDHEGVERCAREARVDLAGSPDDPRVLLDGIDVSRDIRTPVVSEMASRLAVQPGVRRVLADVQREFARRGPVVAEGRDLATVVFPDAQVKIYLDADLETRAARRTRELQSRGIAVSLADVQDDLARRDERDRTRTDSPLQRAADAIVIDTTGMSLGRQVEAVLEIVRAHPEAETAWRAPWAGPAA